MGVPFCKPISKIVGIHWEISGKEILAKDFPCVIICNHQSAWDFMRNISRKMFFFTYELGFQHLT